MISNALDLNLGGSKTAKETKYQWYIDLMGNHMRLSLKTPSTTSKRSTQERRRSMAKWLIAGTCMLVVMSISLANLLFSSNVISRPLSGISSMEASWPKWKIHLLKSWRNTRERRSTPNWSEAAVERDNAWPTWEIWWAKFQHSSKEWPNTDLCYQMIL